MRETNTTQRRNHRRGGFSLIELVIVVVIIGIIAAIAVPKLSRGAAGAADSALSGDLKMLRTALDTYATEHGGFYPAQNAVEAALTTYSDDNGNTNAAKSTTFVYGPYLRAIPPLPVGALKGVTGIGAAGPTVAWVYTPSTDRTSYELRANTTAAEMDAKGVRYDSY